MFMLQLGIKIIQGDFIMAHGLDIILVDDDPAVCESLSMVIKNFYVWGEVISFTDMNEARDYCLSQEKGVAIFVLDVFMGDHTGFSFLDAIIDKFPMAYEDAIIVTGKASDDIVNMCIAADITCLLEKPIKFYSLQLAIRAIVAKYIKFARKLLKNPTIIEDLESIAE
jgi:response regulator of citrate/malate metabolism